MTHTFEPAVYWKFRALCTETQRYALLAQQSQEALAFANKRQIAMMTELHLDPATPNFTLNDDTLTVTIPEPEPEAP